MTASLMQGCHWAGTSLSTTPRDDTSRLTEGCRTACTTNLLPSWRLDPRMHLSRCPILGVHFCDYVSRFKDAAMSCVNFAEDHLEKKLPKQIICSLGTLENRKQAYSKGKIKYLCGRFLTPDKMESLPLYQAAIYTYCDGKTPIWINLYFVKADENYSYIQVLTSSTISSKEFRHPEHPNTSIQFRIRLSDKGEI